MLGRGDRGWAATELRLNIEYNRTWSRHQVNSSGNSDWVATAICMQGQENCLLDEPPDSCRRTAEAIDTGQLPPLPDELQCHLLPGGDRLPLKGVTIRPLSTNTLGLQTMEQVDLGPYRE